MASKLKVQLPEKPNPKEKGIEAPVDSDSLESPETSGDLMEYSMAQGGATEGVSGERYAHHLKIVTDKKGRPQRQFLCVAPEGEFAHLYKGDGTSEAILGKRKL